MKKRMLVAMFALAVALSWGGNAYAGLGDENCPVRGFFQSTGEIISKIMPWNWGKQ